MVTYEGVTQARLDRVTTAAEDWGGLRGRFLGLRDQLAQRVEQPMTAGWEGSAALRAREQVRRAAEQLDAAAEEAHDIATLLGDAVGEFRQAQSELRRLAEVDAPAQRMRITPQGDVVDLVQEDAGPQGLDLGEALTRQLRTTAMAARIQEVLNRATQADQALSWALAQDPNGEDDRGFNPGSFTDLDQADAARRDLGEALDLARREQLGPAELDRLNALLEAHQGDPAFAESFATGLGARGTMEFWRRVNNPDPLHNPTGVLPPERAEALTRLQTSLGGTLATASHGHGEAMAGWKKDMTALGTERFEGPGYSPNGFQLMSSLMRTGRYDSAFLNEYGSALVDAEQAGGKGATLSYTWRLEDAGASWDHLAAKGATGDPMGAFSVALGNNPQAATAFLDPGPDGSNKHLDYLLKERVWYYDGRSPSFPGDPGPLGPALEAAATGDPAGQADGDRRHTEAQARTAQAILVGLKPEAGEERVPKGMEVSVANLLADYVDDTHAAFGGVDARQPSGAADGTPYTTPDGSAHIAVNQNTLIRVMRGAADDPDAYAVMHLAETRKVSETLADIPPGASENQRSAQIQQSAAALMVYDAIRDDVRLDMRDDANDKVEWDTKVIQSIASVADIPTGPAKDIIDPLMDVWLTSVVNDTKEANENRTLDAISREDLESRGQLKEQIRQWAEQREKGSSSSSAVSVLLFQVDNTGRTSYDNALGALRRP
ncbi:MULTISPECIES: DUF6571 family protein [Kitasatospora]|uniref:Uncharacterized protein n=1 Tax=Kitasatospora setae (strain ATCC 33774 / DSM 43861 / JCM 3304 / KCC A-0304 / NBRC 14216 / KM-6054) TaxID=452652 RepID=E4N2R4_KITSK|nr:MULTISPECIES: DUF6571 family protein [Kitasatospora]BAJ32448.1 hypothetical protein KSE_66900 [Kitasatospora setae KM-6054]